MEEYCVRTKRMIDNGKQEFVDKLITELKSRKIEYILLDPLERSRAIRKKEPIDGYFKSKYVDTNSLFVIQQIMDKIPEGINFVIDISKNNKLMEVVSFYSGTMCDDKLIYELHRAANSFIIWKYNLDDAEADLIETKSTKLFRLLALLSFKDSLGNRFFDTRCTGIVFKRKFSEKEFRVLLRVQYILSFFNIPFRLKEQNSGDIILTIE